MKARLNIRLLGGAQFTWDKTPLTTIHSPRLQALLAYLILHREIPQARQHLAYLMFPDSDEAQARTNLRNLIHLLRHALPQADDFLYADAQCLQWKADAPFTFDVCEFETALRDARELADWQHAVELYQGDLLPECYDDWILPERERLRQEFVEALEKLVNAYENAENFFAARKYAQRLLVTDPLREETYRHLILLAAKDGDRASVARYYNQCVNVLAHELDVEPSAETSATFQAALQQTAKTRANIQPASEQKRRHNLPMQLTSFIGRADDVRVVSDAVMQHRLVTLVGAGGVGKTRLALATAMELLEQFADGVWYVDLAPLGDGRLVPQAIATVLNLRESSDTPLAELIVNFLREKQLLLVLDNCEHVLANAQHLTQEFLRAAPQTHILATSRQALNLHGEFVWHTLPLALPDERGTNSIGELMQSPAVQLFVERATTTFPAFSMTDENADAVLKICRRLDGIPLAIELAAARVSLLTAPEIAARLEDTFHLLARGATQEQPHHQTMRAALDWSYETLSDAEQILFRRLAVFTGGFTVEAAEAVCADNENAGDIQLVKSDILDLVANLIDKSLVATYSNDHKPRMRLLEPTRQYAREKLNQACEMKQLREKHLRYFLVWAEQADQHLATQEQKDVLSRLEGEHDNLRAALEWSRSDENKTHGLKLANALVRFWARRGYLAEGEFWLDLMAASIHAPLLMRAKAFSGLGTFKYMQGHFSDAAAYHTQALALYREADDASGIIDSLRDLGVQFLKLAEYSNAQDLFEQSLAAARKEGNSFGIQRALHGLGACLLNQGEHAKAKKLFEEALELAQQGQDKREMVYIYFQLGAATVVTDGLASSAKWCQAALDLARELGDKWGEASGLIGMCAVKRDQGDLAEASALGKLALRMSVEIHGDSKIVDSFEVLATVATARNKAQRAARLFGAGQTLRQAIGFPLEKMDIAPYEQSIAAIRAQLDEDTFEQAWAEGRAMSTAQAIAYALQED